MLPSDLQLIVFFNNHCFYRTPFLAVDLSHSVNIIFHIGFEREISVAGFKPWTAEWRNETRQLFEPTPPNS